MDALVHLGNGFLQVLQPMNLLVLFIGLVLGISDRGALRELFPRTRPTIATLVEELV